MAVKDEPGSRVTAANQWHRIKFSRTELASGIWNRFWVDGLLPVAIKRSSTFTTTPASRSFSFEALRRGSMTHSLEDLSPSHIARSRAREVPPGVLL
jgi:hypothetical protein